MKNKRHIKKAYVTPCITVMLRVSPWLLAGVSGIKTPGEDQIEDGGSLAKPNFWDAWDTEDLGGNETSKSSNPWGED